MLEGSHLIVSNLTQAGLAVEACSAVMILTRPPCIDTLCNATDSERREV